MVEVIWAEPALSDLDAIADYIALENPIAAAQLVRRVLGHIEQLSEHPRSGPVLPELPGWRYRHIVEPPCRVIYRHEQGRVLILHVIRGERLIRPRLLAKRRKLGRK